MFDAVKFYQDYEIPFVTEGKNVTKAWINIKCLFCDDSSHHLGVGPGIDYAICWRCGGHSLIDVVKASIECDFYTAKNIIEEYQTQKIKTKLPVKKQNKNIKVKLPEGTTLLKSTHKDYLESRDFDPDKLVKLYGLQGTGYSGPYKFRIIAPIYLDQKLVSYQGRDVTGKASLRYKTCSKEEEALYHKHTLYAVDLAKKDKVIVVEGITDVWRLGVDVVSTFGTGFTQFQIGMLAKRFKIIFVLYDSSDEAQEKANLLSHYLGVLGKQTEVIIIEKDDPANLTDSEADYLKKQLGF